MNNQQAMQLLMDLGDNAEQVASSLKEQGIKGYHSCYSCPIARFLIKNGAVYGRCAVASLISLSWDLASEAGANSFDPPVGVRMFITAFDSGAYPELEEISQ
jgi:hypothetical protein